MTNNVHQEYHPTDAVTGEKQPAGSFSQLKYNFGLAVKRLTDILISSVALLLLSPVFGIIALLIRRDSPGPVVYRGRRVGRSGKEFDMLKFRTMYEQDASYQGLRLTANGDQRVTPYGRWLRRTKFNELPQLWNVLRGDMSLVGPRPEDPEYARRWPEDVRREVLSLRPGLTSPASIIYRDEEELLKSDSILDDYFKRILPEKLRLDQLYIHNRSYLGDLDVLFMTAILLLPRVRDFDIHEKYIFSGPFYNFINRYVTWFVIDSLVAFLAIAISGLIWRTTAPLELGFLRAVAIAVVIAMILGIVNSILGLKRVTWRYASSIYVFDILLSILITTIILLLINYFAFDLPLLPAGLLYNFALLTFIGLVAVRYRERMLTGLANRWLLLRGANPQIGERILIIGAGDGGQLSIWLIQRSAYARALSIVGFVDDDYHKQHNQVAGFPVLGTTQDIPRVVEKHQIGVIIFSISKCTPEARERILALCRSTGARLVIIPDLMNILERSMMRAAVEERL